MEESELSEVGNCIKPEKEESEDFHAIVSLIYQIFISKF